MRRHNKKRNTALLYEFLIRHISECLIDDKNDEADKAVVLSKKYFSKGTSLYEELKLFKAISEARVKSFHSAQRVIDEIKKISAKLNARSLNDEKSNLIKEINKTVGTQIYSYKIPNYTLYASIQMLFEDQRNKKPLLESVDRIQVEERIIEHLIREKDDKVKEDLKIKPDYNNAVFKFVVERFHKKYDGILSEEQKNLLIKYAIFLISENAKPIIETINKTVENVKFKLKNIKDNDIIEDKELQGKLTECYKKIVVTDFDRITEDNILDLLQYIKLVEEVDSSE